MKSAFILLCILGTLAMGSGAWCADVAAPQSRAEEWWPSWHVTVLPDEGVGLPYDANGCIYWKGKYHLMYIFQDKGGKHCWGHLSSTDLVNWTYHPTALRPNPGDADTGTFSGNAFLNKDGVPMLCWFGIDAGVCVATAQDDALIRWQKHPNNPIVPIPKEGEPAYGVYKVWDPYLWLEGDTYYCLLGGNSLPNGKDTLYLCKSPDLVTWTPVGPFYEHPDLSWTTDGEDCSCPDFFKLGDKHALLCISHKVGARVYIGRFDGEKFYPEQHVRMNWPAGQFFAPESLLDRNGRRLYWAWVVDPRQMSTQRATGSGFQSMPRVLSLAEDGTVRIEPAEELQALRRAHREEGVVEVGADAEVVLKNISGSCVEMAFEIDPGSAAEAGVKVYCAPDGTEETGIWYDAGAKRLKIDMGKSSLRKDVRYGNGPLDNYGNNEKNLRTTVDAPVELRSGETLNLRVFIDGPMLEVYANGRQCVTQLVYPSSKESVGVKVAAKGGKVTVKQAEMWEMGPATFVDNRL